MSEKIKSSTDRIREVLLADGVKPQSVYPYIRAWTWAETGKVDTGLSVATIQTYESDARRVYRLLEESSLL